MTDRPTPAIPEGRAALEARLRAAGFAPATPLTGSPAHWEAWHGDRDTKGDPTELIFPITAVAAYRAEYEAKAWEFLWFLDAHDHPAPPPPADDAERIARIATWAREARWHAQASRGDAARRAEARAADVLWLLARLDTAARDHAADLATVADAFEVFASDRYLDWAAMRYAPEPSGHYAYNPALKPLWDARVAIERTTGRGTFKDQRSPEEYARQAEIIAAIGAGLAAGLDYPDAIAALAAGGPAGGAEAATAAAAEGAAAAPLECPEVPA